MCAALKKLKHSFGGGGSKRGRTHDNRKSTSSTGSSSSSGSSSDYHSQTTSSEHDVIEADAIFADAQNRENLDIARATALSLGKGPAPFQSCQKHPGHSEFVPINSLSASHLPPSYQNEKWVEFIKLKSLETVKLIVSYTSERRPEDLGFTDLKGKNTQRLGSGTAFMMDMKTEQRCRRCSEVDGEHPRSGYFRIMTAAHVVFDDQEAEKTEIEFFYDSDEDRSGVVKAKGVRINHIDTEQNRSVIECYTHDLTLCEKLEQARNKREQLRKELQESINHQAVVILISHPHGTSKRVTIGDLKELTQVGEVKTTSDGTRLIGCFLSYTAPSCPGAGGGSVNVLGQGEVCLAFAPHCASMNDGTNLSGLGWTKYPVAVMGNAVNLRNM